MIMRDGEFPTMMQQQEEDEDLKPTEKEHQAVTSNAGGEGFASRSACTFLAPFSSVFHTP